MKKSAVYGICLMLTASMFLHAQTPAPSAPTTPSASTTPTVQSQAGTAGERQPGDLSPFDEQRLQIIRFGTDTEIANLIKILRNEQPSSPAGQTNGGESPPASRLEKELMDLAQNTKNRSILTGVFAYFGDREMSGLETRARTAIEERDYEAGETVNAALLYLGNVKASGARDLFEDIINGEESRFITGAIQALGKTAEKDGPAETAEFLIDYYTNREPGDENRRLIITALGDMKAKEGTAFLVSIAENEDEKTPLRMAALDALAKISDPAGLDAVIGAVSSKDPNVRSAAVSSLGPFSGKDTEAAIIEAFRDSYYRTRIAAAKAAGERKLAAAVPYLRFRSENDDVPAVRDEAIKAMGLIGGDDTESALKDLFKERKNSDRVRINAGEMLLTHGKNDYVADIITEMDEAKAKNQTPLYNGFLRILGAAKSPKLEDLARRFFASGGVIEKSYAMDICSNNNFRGLADDIRKLTDPKNGSLSNKSRALLEKWGLPLTSEPSASSAPSVPPTAAPVPEGTATP